jgi:hypothetical protein
MIRQLALQPGFIERDVSVMRKELNYARSKTAIRRPNTKCKRPRCSTQEYDSAARKRVFHDVLNFATTLGRIDCHGSSPLRITAFPASPANAAILASLARHFKLDR